VRRIVATGTIAGAPPPTPPHKGEGRYGGCADWPMAANAWVRQIFPNLPYELPPPLWGRVGVGESHLMPHSNIDQKTRNRARELRKSMTEPERRLWRRLRELERPGVRIRRQTPIGPYIVDFACLSRRLVIEVDGDLHGHDAGIAHDAKRTEWLDNQGYRVLRFWNTDVCQNIDGVLETIQIALEIPDVRHD
jgi:very-short-patch-repair endonuclease